ncbi:hypothetical protein [Massilia glaciei]|uniref:Uncharacterized protein n=1 Tax=Massilia glaciei TaxID=1524097 RepID=A0A2U2HGX5_9BURK|nr:hypothetical protein [Massilia glaciei]PWF44686.1 hypothetical protein C7C56_019000 [Massilia glaciei]
MAYFIILPVFVVWLLVAGAAMVACRLIPSCADAWQYVWRIALWATVGFIVANAALWFFLMPALAAMPSNSDSSGMLKSLWGLVAIGAPFLITPIGWAIGAAIGFFLGHRTHHARFA